MTVVRKYSRQREAIKEYLMGREDHPTAEMIYFGVREENPKISLGTVYRNLSLLEETGEIIKVTCGDGVERYDARVIPHYHYYCRSCGCVKDLMPDGTSEPKSLMPGGWEDDVEGCNILFYGICQKCKNSN